ncbi:hypothetical protein [Streptomyces sp. NPDC056069]|uniref:hypothetical protein n=1 Tax=Streptomyces sp. NPDC056069 TaxID=3345702 RepID=UPI0035DDB7FB
MDKLRYLVEQTFALLHQFKRLTGRENAAPNTPRRLRLPRLQPYLLETPHEGPLLIASQAITRSAAPA